MSDSNSTIFAFKCSEVEVQSTWDCTWDYLMVTFYKCWHSPATGWENRCSARCLLQEHLFHLNTSSVSFSLCDRTDGGITKGTTIGVLLDFSRRIIIFLINDEQQGPVAFEGLEGVYYPAISINRNVQVQNDTDAPKVSDLKEYDCIMYLSLGLFYWKQNLQCSLFLKIFSRHEHV